MAEAATAETLDRAADRAAADAAVEARRESLEQAGSRPAVASKTPGRDRAAATDWHRFEVIGWLTDLNPVEFGFYKRSRNKAKSRQFTSDMDIYAEVFENGERTGLIGYRQDLWANGKGLDKRLVFKLFSEGLHWRATMDLMLARSIQQTIGARGLPVMTYSVNTNGDDQVVYIERSANQWPAMPENFSFFLMEDGHLRFFRLRQVLFSLGQDYQILNERNEEIAYLDGALLSLKQRWRCRIRADYKAGRLPAIVKMICGMLPFNRTCRRHIRQLTREARLGRLPDTNIERQEADLYMNPRRVR